MQAMAAARTAFSLKFSQVTQREEGVWGWHEVTECIRMIKLLKGLRCQTIYTAFLYSTLRRLYVCVCGCLAKRCHASMTITSTCVSMLMCKSIDANISGTKR